MKQHTPYSNFIQQSPKLSNEFEDDIFLQDYLATYLEDSMKVTIFNDLRRFGERAATELMEYTKVCESNPPKLTHFDAWGNRIDEIKVAPEWNKLKKVAAEEGLVAIGYERNFGRFSRLYQFVKLYLYTPSSAIFSCPLAMTDGAARLIEKFGDEKMKNELLKGLTSRDSNQFLTSGQWMTERAGGSDVSRSMTLAKEIDGTYYLYGHKWFTSAITADMAFTLASTSQPSNGKRAPLTLFYLPIRNVDGSLNGIKVEALKDKLGTKALPTAQLHLNGAKAVKISEEGRGVKMISTLFNITRIYNTMTAVSYMRRAFSLADKYSHIRETFGKKISQHPLHKISLRKMEIEYQSNALLCFFLTQLLGKDELNEADDTDIALLRLLTPVSKLYTAKGVIKAASEEIEMFGGLGYLEDTFIPMLLRDAQVLSIWEGTTNVLALDMIRAIQKESVLPPFIMWAKQQLESNKIQQKHKEILSEKIRFLTQQISAMSSPEDWEKYARSLAFFIAELSIGILWIDFNDKMNFKKELYASATDYWLSQKIQTTSFDAINRLL